MLELGNTPDGREKIRQLLVEKGSFDKVELVVKQWQERKKTEEVAGGYVTKKWLMDNKSYTQCRKNIITGEEEADIPLDEKWQVKKEQGQRLEFETGCEMDDPNGSLLEETGFSGEDHLQDFAGSSEALPAVSVAAAQAGASFKLCFPALQQNVSPASILPSFLTVLGRKLDNGEEAKDKCLALKTARSESIANDMTKSLESLQKIYDELLKKQALAATATTEDELTKMIEAEIVSNYVAATKEDLEPEGQEYRDTRKPEESESSSDDLFDELLEGSTLVQELLVLPAKLKSGRDPMLERLARCARGGKGNACRNLHRMLADDKLCRLAGAPVVELGFWAKYSCIDGGHPLFSSEIVEFLDKTYKIHFAYLGLNYFPMGIGKGFDTILLLEWLQDFLRTADQGHRNLFDVLVWTIESTNSFFKPFYGRGIWIPSTVASDLVSHGYNMLEGYGYLAALCVQRRWALFKLKPKIHMQAHLMTLGI
ncbi:unnamed protein product [Symbiodinium sp. CCMP2592]|nr:unnamed protein product [Symbiodinium sp. CCMP2592]